jgi:hypothetical protein
MVRKKKMNKRKTTRNKAKQNKAKQNKTKQKKTKGKQINKHRNCKYMDTFACHDWNCVFGVLLDFL